MFKGNARNIGTFGLDSPIPYRVVFNTNSNTYYDSENNELVFRKPGYYDIKVSTVFSGTTSAVSMALYSGEVMLDTSRVALVADSATDETTLTISDVIKVVPEDLVNGYARMSVRFSSTDDTVELTIANSTLIAEQRK